MKTVKELLKIAIDKEETLFPEFDSDWWTGIYNSDTSEDIDILFTRYYANYEFYSSIEDLFDEYTDNEALLDFRRAVYALFMKNDKKYTELYRIHTIPDNEAYELTNNYDMHETYSGSNSLAGSSITGQRTDVTIDQMGEQEMSNLNKVTGYNSSAENTNDSSNSATGSREDTHQFTKGQEQDTSRTQGTDTHTLRRYGNIGVMTVDDLLRKHTDFWLVWDFLQVIFDDICRDYLLIGR